MVLTGGGCLINGHFGSRPPLTDICERRPGLCEDDRAVRLINQLRESSVLIRTEETLGSGIIIAQSRDETVILTNRHVIDPDGDLEYPTGITVNNNGRSIEPRRILIAPDGVDLAAVVVEGGLGPPIRMNGGNPPIGTNIFVVGSPLGSEDSVSAGIVSNLRHVAMADGFEFDAIQTDAAVNPGNSGGGIFDADTGELLGIITFKLRISMFQTAEGMAFAIPTSVLDRFPYAGWRQLAREN
jgi:serine protease Do